MLLVTQILYFSIEMNDFTIILSLQILWFVI